MKAEMIRLGDKSIVEKIKILGKMEQHKTLFMNNIPKRKNEYQENKPKKWCRLNRTPYHDDQECFSQKDKKITKWKSSDNKDDKKDERYNLIKEVNRAPSKLVLAGKIKDIKVEFLIDSGATANYITRKKLRELDCEYIEETNADKKLC